MSRQNSSVSSRSYAPAYAPRATTPRYEAPRYEAPRSMPATPYRMPADTMSRADRNRLSNGNTYVAPGGQVFHPNNSRIVDQHLSANGNLVTVRNDGIRQTTLPNGRVINQRIVPTSQAYRPSSAAIRSYSPRNVNITNVTVNQHNTYIRETGTYFASRPVFYSGYAWQPPSFTAVVLGAGLTMAAIDLAYAASYPRYSFNAWSAPTYWAPRFQQTGIYNSYDLVSRGRTETDREQIALQTGMPYVEVRKAVGQADLMRVSGIGPVYSRYLVDAGINSVQDLARCYEFGPDALIEQMRYSQNYTGGPLPSRYEVEQWMAQAQAMPVAVYDDDRQPMVP